MNGLRIFVEEKATEYAGGVRVFYTRRSEGPYYRWHYEELPKQWRADRMHGSKFSTDSLCIWRWKDVPAGLKISLIEHYAE